MKDEFKKKYQFNEYVLGYDKGGNDRSALTISKVLNGNMYVMATLTDGSANVISLMLDELNKELQATKAEKYKAIEFLKLFDRDSDLINHSIIRGALNILQGDDNNETMDKKPR